MVSVLILKYTHIHLKVSMLNESYQMKKVLLIALSVLFSFAGCKKSGNDKALVNTISATVDSVNETFNSNVTASQTSINGINILNISGKKTADTNLVAIGIIIDTSAVITEGSYPVKTGVGFNGTYISYVQGYLTFLPDSNTTVPNSITISHITNTNVQGTFRVTLSCSAFGTNLTTKTITNGKFNVSIKQVHK